MLQERPKSRWGEKEEGVFGYGGGSLLLYQRQLLLSHALPAQC